MSQFSNIDWFSLPLLHFSFSFFFIFCFLNYGICNYSDCLSLSRFKFASDNLILLLAFDSHFFFQFNFQRFSKLWKYWIENNLKKYLIGFFFRQCIPGKTRKNAFSARQFWTSVFLIIFFFVWFFFWSN